MALKSENENKFNNSVIVMAEHCQGSTQLILLYSTKILIDIFFMGKTTYHSKLLKVDIMFLQFSKPSWFMLPSISLMLLRHMLLPLW